MDQHCRFAILLFLFGIIGVYPKTSHQVASGSEQSRCHSSPAVDQKVVSDSIRGISDSSEKLSQKEDSNESSKPDKNSGSKFDPNRSLPDGSQKQTRKNYRYKNFAELRLEIKDAMDQDRQAARERALRAREAAVRGEQQNAPRERDRSPPRRGRK